jgi:hypothetical protein
MQQNYIHIRGNHDRQLINRPVADMGLSDRAAHGQLNSRHLAWLASLPATKMLAEDVLLCHGSPSDDLEYLLEEVDGDRVRLASPKQIQQRLETFEPHSFSVSTLMSRESFHSLAERRR